MEINRQALQEKWAPVLDSEDAGSIKDAHRRSVTAVVLENQEKAVREDSEFMTEAAPANSTAAAANWDPVLISLVRRAMPNLIAYDVCGVQPMTGPTGLIFAMRSRYSTTGGTEALYNEANTEFSTVVAGSGNSGDRTYFRQILRHCTCRKV